MVDTPAAYRWSSHARNASGVHEPRITPHPPYRALGLTAHDRERAYRAPRSVNIVLSNLQCSLDGAYPSFGFFKYVRRYLAQTADRFALEALVPRLLVAAARGTPRSERELRYVPVYAS